MVVGGGISPSLNSSSSSSPVKAVSRFCVSSVDELILDVAISASMACESATDNVVVSAPVDVLGCIICGLAVAGLPPSSMSTDISTPSDVNAGDSAILVFYGLQFESYLSTSSSIYILTLSTI